MNGQNIRTFSYLSRKITIKLFIFKTKPIVKPFTAFTKILHFEHLYLLFPVNCSFLKKISKDFINESDFCTSFKNNLFKEKKQKMKPFQKQQKNLFYQT